jgi:hypothetical protein
MAYDLKQITLDDVGIRTAQIARVRETDTLGTSPDDIPALSLFYDAAILRVATLCNLISELTTSTDGTLGIDTALIPRRMWTALTFFVMKEWFKATGEIDLATFYEAVFQKEADTYRFNPDGATFATRTYCAF